MTALKTRVIILTRTYRIEGIIDLIPGARLTDFMNEVKSRFMVVTEARVWDHAGREVLSAGFIDVHVDTIEVILPVDEE